MSVSEQPIITCSKDKFSHDVTAESLSKAENIGYLKINDDLVIQYVSPTFYEVLGADQSLDFTGQRLDDVLDNVKLTDIDTNLDLSFASLLSRIAETQATNNEQRTTVLHTTQDGRQIRFNMWCMNADVLICTARDISEDRRRISLLEIAMDAADAGFWSMNFNTGKFTYSDSVTRRLTMRLLT